MPGEAELVNRTRHIIRATSGFVLVCMVGVLLVGCAGTGTTGSTYAKHLSSIERNRAGKSPGATTHKSHPLQALLPLDWRAAPVPSGASNGFLVGVSCVSARFCVSVGSSSSTPEAFSVWQMLPRLVGDTGSMSPPGSSWHAIVEIFGGHTWHDAPILAPVANSALNAVSCASPRFCAAVGSSPAGALIVTFNGKYWRNASSSRRARRVQSGVVLNAISCVSTTFCVSVGYRETETKVEAVIETFNGHSWRLSTSQHNVSGLRAVSTWYPWVKSFRRVELNGVSCVSARSCVAVGHADTSPSGFFGGGSGFPVVDVYNGKIWKASIQLPNIISSSGTNGETNGLEGVSCSSMRFCVAVGSWFSPWSPGIQIVQIPPVYSSVVETFDRGLWFSVSSAPSNATVMDDVSCVSKTFCVGVSAPGTYFAPTMFNQPPPPTAGILRAETFNGSTWQGSVVSAGPSMAPPDLYSISCARERMSVSCMAVGMSNWQVPAKRQVVVEIASPAGNLS
ncbi:MAG: hypothetical protein ACYDEY_11900 [Acidimicrobiales bacterium]